MNLAIWTGGSMNAGDAIDKLRRDGFPVEDVDTTYDGAAPAYDRRVGESGESAQARYQRAVETYETERRAAALAQAGAVALRLIAESAATRSHHAEWRGEKGSERAVLALSAEYDKRFPAAGPPQLAYVIGPWELLADVAKQGVHHQPGSVRREPLPGITPRAYMAFMSTTLALCPQAGIRYPVIVAHDAYAVCLTGNTDDDRVSVGIMPTRERVGVVGASAEQVMADLKATIEAEAAGEKPVSFDPNDFKTRLRLRRKLAGGGDNG